MSFFRKTKDRLIEKTAPSLLNETVMRDYGQITSLEIDSADKTLHVEVLLRGEKDPLRVEILKYEIAQQDGRTCFIAREIRTSREWISTLAQRQLVGRPIPLPQQLSGLVSRLL
jgi:hypothetical protein